MPKHDEMSRHTASIALISGLIFAVGLALAGMTLPSKVVGFFDFHDGLASWDPSLALVMGGGVAVYTPVYWWLVRRGRPLMAETLEQPKRKTIDARLLIGAALFGIGWGLVGFCPGPAITSLGSASWQAAIVVAAMTGGIWLFRAYEARTAA